MVDDSKDQVAAGKVALDELEGGLHQGRRGQQSGRPRADLHLEKDACKRQIMKFASEIKSKEDLLTKLDAAVAQLTVQSRQGPGGRDKAGDQTRQDHHQPRDAEGPADHRRSEEQPGGMKGVIETSVVGVASGQTSSISLTTWPSKSQDHRGRQLSLHRVMCPIPKTRPPIDCEVA